MLFITCGPASSWNDQDNQHWKIYCHCMLVKFAPDPKLLFIGQRDCHLTDLWGHMALLHNMIYGTVMNTGHLCWLTCSHTHVLRDISLFVTWSFIMFLSCVFVLTVNRLCELFFLKGCYSRAFKRSQRYSVCTVVEFPFMG